MIGSGPASITVAADVRREGHEVTIFEAFHKPGGVMIYGIPEFRLPKKIVEDELHTLEEMGVEIRTNFLVGQTRKLKDLLEKDGYDAAFIGTGAGLPRFMRIEGENLVGVFAANEFLTRSNLMKAYDRDQAETPIFQPKRVAVSAAGTSRWTPRARRSGSARRRSTSSIGAAASRCRRAPKKSTTPKKRASSSCC